MSRVTPVDLTGFQRDVLAATHHAQSSAKPPNGQDILAILKGHHYDHVPPGRFYPTLNDLVNDGLIEKTPDEDDKRVNRYRVTKDSIRLLNEQRKFLTTRGPGQEGSA